MLLNAALGHIRKLFQGSNMNANEDIQLIEQLCRKATQKEDELTQLKETINNLCEDAKLPKPYPDLRAGASGDISAIRSDQFYGQPLSTAIRAYLDTRKAAGRSAASLNDIYMAVKTGGFAFNTRDEENAKASVRLTLRKNSSIFHRVPSGEYGLLSWYPNAKEQKTSDVNGEESAVKKLARKIIKNSKAKKDFERESQ
jgi:hypothetical protein